MKRRIAQSAVLLFCSSLASAQVKVERSMFREAAPSANMPSFIVRMQESPGAQMNLGAGGSISNWAASPGNKFRLDRADASSDSTEVVTNNASTDSTPTTKSPSLAMLLSAIIPGSGQIYVHRYFTIPIIWGFGYYFAKAWNDQNDRYNYYRELFDQSVKADSTHQGNGVYQKTRDFYRDDRDKFAFYLAITYILNIVDAYVGASLYSFDVSNNLGGSAALRLRIPIR